LAQHRRFGQALCGLAVLLLAHAYGAWRLWQLDTAAAAQPPRTLRLALVQGGMNTKGRWTPQAFSEALQAYTVPSRAALIQWAQAHPAQALPSPAENTPATPARASAWGNASMFSSDTLALPRPGSAPRHDPAPPAGTVPAGPLAQDTAPPTAGLQQQTAPATPPAAASQVPGAGQPQAETAPAGFVATPENPACLLVWPESCIPRRVEQPLSAYVPGEIAHLLDNYPNAGLLYGAAGHPEKDDLLENGAVLLAPPGGQLSWVGSKLRLVGFGEVLPFRGVIRFLEYPWGSEDISVGEPHPPFSFAGHRLGVQVCFDNVFGYVSRRAAQQGAEALLLVTNNSWYDLASGIRQHCELDIMRAVETRRALGRVSTTGWSHLVLPSGRVAATSTVLNTPAVVEEWVPLRSAQSPYTVAGDVVAQLCLLAGALLALRVLLAGRSEGWL
jgi:apolipoprotein N-acyltransferase